MQKLKITAGKVARKDFKGDPWVVGPNDIPFVASKPTPGLELLGEPGYFFVIWRPTPESEQTELITRTSMYSLLLMVAGGKKISDIIAITDRVNDALTRGNEVWDNRELWAKGHRVPLK